MTTLVCNEPNLESLTTAEKSLLFKPLIQKIKDFYKEPQNRQAYQNWLALKSPSVPASEMTDFTADTAPNHSTEKCL